MLAGPPETYWLLGGVEKFSSSLELVRESRPTIAVYIATAPEAQIDTLIALPTSSGPPSPPMYPPSERREETKPRPIWRPNVATPKPMPRDTGREAGLSFSVQRWITPCRVSNSLASLKAMKPNPPSPVRTDT